ncbi:alpha-amylase family protein [Arenibacter sp. GZD96]|uniref:alpha-amylase family protein n=1 Tax=Aurantibrevibacter litoralis TaxID=3106030 RepID=UPI002AFF7151|nr:alpha-amylase family protein [Arenibacter sp. GZD-96]MEA1785701.1 alpha-amylase family protein [Arenibacter sp. GZD-96]
MNQAELHRLMAAGVEKKDGAKNLQKLFELRLATNVTLIKDLFFRLYPEEAHTASFQKLWVVLPRLFRERSQELQLQDIERIKAGNWYQSEQLVGTQLYVDRFSKNLKGLSEKLSYWEKLGVNFVHLMPITPRPRGENDGGYAVNSYHEVDPRFGTKEDLLALTQRMRAKKMFLMLDFVVNHTSDEYPWAKKAMQGDKKYQAYYYTYPDRLVPDEFEKSLPEIFPESAPGNFTFNQKMERWVMTVFNRYQWDLNYTNPEVFLEMLGNLMKLVNTGVDVVRLDALAFLWKKLGTQSQNLQEAHTLVSLFRMCLQVVAPGTIFLAEAIVSPPEIIKYFGEDQRKGNECEVAYNATLMALLWDAIATKKTLLLTKSLGALPEKPKEGTWINYIRCHDDIGLGFEDRFIYEIGWNASMHRRFLLDYYCQGLSWSPSKGLIFMYNPRNGDGRITGSAASLLGLERALEERNSKEIQKAIDKIVLLHSIIFSFGGIPLIYAGDEIGTLNDYSFLKDATKRGDSRWVNRPFQDWKAVAELEEKPSYRSEIFYRLQTLITVRKRLVVFADQGNLTIHHIPNPHVLVYERTGAKGKGILVLCNLDEAAQKVALFWLAHSEFAHAENLKDLVSDRKIGISTPYISLLPYQSMWLQEY